MSELVVIGGCGFVGRAIVNRILTIFCDHVSRSDDLKGKIEDDSEPKPQKLKITFSRLISFFSHSAWKIVIIDPRADSLSLRELFPEHPNLHYRIELVTLELGSPNISSYLSLAHTVFHCASPPSPIYSDAPFSPELYRDFIDGTKSLIEKCREAGVGRLIFTSCATVLLNPKTPFLPITEQSPLPSPPLHPYFDALIKAENLLLQANERKKFNTCILRPSYIFGPNDHWWPLFIKLGITEQSIWQIGNIKYFTDWIYIDNVAHAHLLAFEKLSSDRLAGEIYLITNDQRMAFWSMPLYVWKKLNFQPSYMIVPIWFASVVAQFNDSIYYPVLQPIVRVVVPRIKELFSKLKKQPPPNPTTPIADQTPTQKSTPNESRRHRKQKTSRPNQNPSAENRSEGSDEGEQADDEFEPEERKAKSTTSNPSSSPDLVSEPPERVKFTYLRFQMLTYHHWFSIEKAKKDLGYQPIVSMDEGLQRTVQSYEKFRSQKELFYHRLMDLPVGSILTWIIFVTLLLIWTFFVG